jgi:hypothetical protein
MILTVVLSETIAEAVRRRTQFVAIERKRYMMSVGSSNSFLLVVYPNLILCEGTR